MKTFNVIFVQYVTLTVPSLNGFLLDKTDQLFNNS